jgi:AraC-like DNA-binding protein
LPQGCCTMRRAHIEDLDEVVQLVEQVYGPHRLRLHPRAAGLDASLHVAGPKHWPIVRLRYGAAVRGDSEPRDAVVIKSCVWGAGSVRQGGQSAQWRQGSIIPLAAHLPKTFEFGPEFATVSLRLRAERLEMLCSRWLGHPLDTELRLALVPFSDALQRTWHATLALIESSVCAANALPPAAEAALEEFVLTLLLRGHPHTYSDELARPEKGVSSRLVRRAVQFIKDHSSGALTASQVAEGIGVSVRGLQAGFREWRQVTPTAYLRSVRLRRVREALVQADASTTVSGVALDHGFLHLGRFSQHYKNTFGECPATTLARVRRRVIRK